MSTVGWWPCSVRFPFLAFGGLQLVRQTTEGFGSADDGDANYYVGWTVVHVHFVVLLTNYLDVFLVAWNGWLAAVASASKYSRSVGRQTANTSR